MNPSRPSFAPEIESPAEVITTSSLSSRAMVTELPLEHQALLVARLLWQHRRFVASVLWRGTLLTLVVAFLIPVTYESKTQLMPPEQHSGALGMLAAMTGGLSGGSTGAGGALDMVGDLLGIKTTGALFVSMLRSETIQDHLIDRFDLRKAYGTATYNSARRKLSSRTDIGEDKKSGVIAITVTDRSPQRAADIARAYVDELNRMVVDLDTSSAHRERVFLEDRLKVVKKDLDASSKAFSEFASKNTAIDIKEQGKAMLQSAAVLQGQLMATQAELSGLEQIYTANNVRVRSLQARVAELQRQLQKLGGAGVDESSGQAADQMYPSIRQLPVLGVPYYNLYREVMVNETIFQTLTKEYEMARIEEAKQVPSVKVIDVAQAPERRSGPPRKLIVMAGILLSLGFAATWLFVREAWRGADPRDPRKQFLEEIGASLRRNIPWKSAFKVSSTFNSIRIWRRTSSDHNVDSDHGESLD